MSECYKQLETNKLGKKKRKKSFHLTYVREIKEYIWKTMKTNFKRAILLLILTLTLCVLWTNNDVKVRLQIPLNGLQVRTGNHTKSVQIHNDRSMKFNNSAFSKDLDSLSRWEHIKSKTMKNLKDVVDDGWDDVIITSTNKKKAVNTLQQNIQILDSEQQNIKDDKNVRSTATKKDSVGRNLLKDSENPSQGLNGSNFQAQDTKAFQKGYKFNRVDLLDLMKLKPFKFLPNYKNPCWKQNNANRLVACLPFFYLVGAPKAGTTDVYTRLKAHPDFASPIRKEPHWLTRRRFFDPMQTSISIYIHDYFAKAALEIQKSEDESGYHWKVTGDCSASTFFDNMNWHWLPHRDGLQEPELTNADYIHHLNPATRIIVMLREPVDRLYSDFLYFTTNTSQSDFHHAVTEKLAWLNQCQQKASLRACLYDRLFHYKQTKYQQQARINIGVYHVHLKEFLRVLPRDQILVVKLEEYSRDVKMGMERIFRFLGFRETTNMRKEELLNNSTKPINARRSVDRKLGGMWNVTRKLLQDFYRPHNEALASLLNDNSFNYNDMYS